MCILAIITNHSARFPFILITNRDEVLDRVTYPLAVDAASGLLWALDGVAGGSWLGLELLHGRLATVTNCRRAPTAPLLFHSPAEAASARQMWPRLFASDEWRGAAPLADTLAYTKCVPCAPPTSPSPSSSSCARTLLYEPLTSRGTIIKTYLMNGSLPGNKGGALPPSLQAPHYAGYNLLTCDSLFGGVAHSAERPFTVKYTTNRFYAENAKDLAHGEVHCLQNSFLDNWAEPKSVRLRERFESVLAGPLLSGNEGSDAAALQTAEAQGIASAFADVCLCDVPNFDLPQLLKKEEEEGRRAGTSTTMSLRELLESTDPRLGFTSSELARYFADTGSSNGSAAASAADITDDDAFHKECYLQQNVFVMPRDGYGTRVQSVVLTERYNAVGNGASCSPVYKTHFCQRQVAPTGKGPVECCGPWVHFTVAKDGAQRVDGA